MNHNRARAAARMLTGRAAALHLAGPDVVASGTKTAMHRTHRRRDRQVLQAAARTYTDAR